MIDDIFEEARVSLMVMPEDGATTQEEIIIEQLNCGLLDLEESKDLYDDDKEFFKHLLSSGEWSIEDLCVYVDFKDPNLLDIIKNIVLDAYKSSSDFEVLYCLPSKLQNNKEVVLAAVSNHGYAFHYASERLKNDKEVILAAVREDGCVLDDLSKRLQDDKEVVLAAVSNHGMALKCASAGLKDDKEVVMAAVSNTGSCLSFVSNRLIKDKDIYLEALRQDPESCNGCSNSVLFAWDIRSLQRESREAVYNWFKATEEDLFILAKAKKHLLN